MKTFEPTAVPKEFAQSLAPRPIARTKEMRKPVTTIHTYVVSNAVKSVIVRTGKRVPSAHGAVDSNAVLVKNDRS